MTDKTKPCEVEILDEDVDTIDTHITAQETDQEVYLGDGCWGKPDHFEH